MIPEMAPQPPNFPTTQTLRTVKIILGLRLPCGQGIGSWQAYHEFEPSTTTDPLCRGAMHVKSVESSNVLPLVWCGS
ncbi:hypothetical protein TNCV_554351 [Trichonephila clavipes]|nr:hypothetical protein TNCV_554351 [Trichonephila clavipes]